MLFKMHNPRACDEVCGSAVRLRSQSNSVWQLRSASAAGSPLIAAFIVCIAGLHFDFLLFLTTDVGQVGDARI